MKMEKAERKELGIKWKLQGKKYRKKFQEPEKKGINSPI